jgi:hypothetical protein
MTIIIYIKNNLMGTLTLKSLPFEFQGCNVKKLDTINPTDSFGF